MKSFFLSTLALLCTLLSHSQNQVGIFFGPQATQTKYTILNQKQKNEFKYGFQAGVNMKTPFEGNLYFAPAVFYSMKGYKVKFTDFAFPPDVNAVDNKTIIHTFEIAPLLQYDFGQNPGHVFIRGGPTLDFQLFGKEEYNLASGTRVKQNMKFSYGDYGHFSANAIAQIGYETVDDFMIFAQYTHGLASINNADGGPRIRHRVFGISIGKYLNKKKIIIDTRNRE